MKIGILLPQSKMYPRLAQDFAEGLRLITESIDCQLFIEDIHFGTSEAVIIEKAQKLILQHNVKCVVSFMTLDESVIQTVNNFFHESKIPFIICDIGGNIPPNLDYSPYVMINSLQVWKSNWAMGEYFAKEKGKALAISMGLHESGYSIGHLVRVGVEEEEGKNVFTQLVTNEIEMTALEKAFQETDINGVYANFSGVEGTEFISKFEQTDLKKKTELFVNSFMSEHKNLAQHGEQLEDVSSVHTWSETLDNKENEKFMTDFEEEYDEIPNSFALLGYETGLIINQIIGLKPKQIKDLFQNLEIQSPRGLLKRKPWSKGLDAPIYLRKVKKRADGQFVNEVQTRLETPKKIEEKIPLILRDSVSGWTNPYLCA